MSKARVAAFGALALLSCGKQTALTLPEDQVDRAATCAVVAAAEARLATDVRQVLTFEAQGPILHPALIAASQGGSFSGETANRVSIRMTELAEGITGGKWQDLVPACRAAFPQSAESEIALPQNGFEARLGCNELADFMITALAEQESDYGNELAEYRALKRRLESPLVPGLRSRAGSDLQAQRAERRKALAAFSGLGSPVIVLKQCIRRFD